MSEKISQIEPKNYPFNIFACMRCGEFVERPKINAYTFCSNNCAREFRDLGPLDDEILKENYKRTLECFLDHRDGNKNL